MSISNTLFMQVLKENNKIKKSLEKASKEYEYLQNSFQELKSRHEVSITMIFYFTVILINFNI